MNPVGNATQWELMVKITTIQEIKTCSYSDEAGRMSGNPLVVSPTRSDEASSDPRRRSCTTKCDFVNKVHACLGSLFYFFSKFLYGSL